MKHLSYLRTLNYVMAALVGVGGLAMCFFMSFMARGAASTGPADPTFILTWNAFLAAMAVLMVVFAGLHWWAGSLVGEGRGRILQTVLLAMSIGNAPVGTAYGVYALWVCWLNDETKRLFR